MLAHQLVEQGPSLCEDFIVAVETTQEYWLAATAAAAASPTPLASSEFSLKFSFPTDTLHTTRDTRICKIMKRGGKKEKRGREEQ